MMKKDSERWSNLPKAYLLGNDAAMIHRPESRAYTTLPQLLPGQVLLYQKTNNTVLLLG